MQPAPVGSAPSEPHSACPAAWAGSGAVLGQLEGVHCPPALLQVLVHVLSAHRPAPVVQDPLSDGGWQSFREIPSQHPLKGAPQPFAAPWKAVLKANQPVQGPPWHSLRKHWVSVVGVPGGAGQGRGSCR